MGKRLAILQSAYVPWKGYFDLIASVDEFVLYDDAQFTKHDWRNRNRIKTPAGTEWLTVPVGSDIHRRIRDVTLPDPRWQAKHWRSLQANYARAAHFEAIAAVLEPLFMGRVHTGLGALNRCLIEAVCALLRIDTPLTDSSQYRIDGDRSERLVGICRQAGADVYVSGPAARAYLDEAPFAAHGIAVQWFDYAGYPEYPQLWGPFVHEVSVLDLLFNCGGTANRFMRHCAK